MQLRGIQDGAALGGGIRESVRRVMIEVLILWMHVVLVDVGKGVVCIRHEDAGYIACRRRGEGNPLLNSSARFWQSDVRCMFKLHRAPSLRRTTDPHTQDDREPT
jgi:hypothetical protein